MEVKYVSPLDLKHVHLLLLRLSCASRCWRKREGVACMYARCRRHRLYDCVVVLLFVQGFHLRCQCFAGMSIYLFSGKFLALADVLFLGEVMPNFFGDPRPYML